MFIKTLVSHPYISTILELPTSDLLLAAGALFAVIKFFIVLYRLSPLHPLSKVPGPRLAAATWWYRIYYEALPQGGLMHDKIKKMHEKYGPVVRISPNDVHFASPSAYLHIYSTASKTVKDPYHYKCFNEDLSSFGFCNPVTARQRRDLLHPFFSRRNILHMHHVIEDKLCLLTHQLRIMSKSPEKPEGEPVDMSLAAKSFTMDVIMEFCFARTLDILRAPAFGHCLLGGTEKALPMFYVFKHFTSVKHIVLNMPNWLALWLTPDASKGVLLLQNVLGDQLDKFLKDPEGMAEGVEHEVIYHRLLGVGKFGDKDENGETVPRQNIGRKSLYHEAQALLFAGSDTVGNTIAVGTFHILRTPGVVDRLIQELRTVWPGNPWVGMPAVGEEYKDGSGRLPVGWETFEKLPYLSAVVKESLRLSHGCVSPLARLAPAQGVTVDGWTFPAGTGIASSAPSVHLDPTVFPDPHTFRPERWLGPNAVELERYLVPFSKGPRQCLGINLAWCELYLTFATLYRRFEFENFETKPEDLEYRDFLIPVLNGRIKVRAKARLD